MQLKNPLVNIFPNKHSVSVLFFIAAIHTGCGGGGDRAGVNTANTTIGGSVSGLVNPMVLQNNGGDNLNLTADGSFTFSTKIGAGSLYAVTVFTQPAGQTCIVSKGTGTVSTPDNITDVLVACSVIDPNAPRVIATTPASASKGIALNSIVSARFSETMNPATLTNTSFSVRAGGSVSDISGAVSMSADKRSAIFTPNPGLSANTRYTLTLTTAVQDATNSGLISNVNSSFTTGAALDNTPPTVTGTSPVSGATSVPTNSVITANFSEAINPATLTSATFKVSSGTPSTEVSGNVAASADNRSATFTPAAPLVVITTYTAKLTTGITDTAGVTLASNNAWNFTTGTAADTTLPLLSTHTPAANATLQEVSTTIISATFSKPINCATVSTDSFQVLEGNVPVPGFTECNSGTLLFKPQIGTFLPSNTTLNASLAASIKDLADNAISAYSWSFGMAPWTRQLGTAETDGAAAITRDSVGNVYAAGYTWGAMDGQINAGAGDMFITKYDVVGVKQWTRQLGTASYDSATAITSDAAGNVYVAGWTGGALDGQSFAGLYDLFITKYNSAGVKQWTRQLGSASADYASAITIDAAGNVYAAGNTGGALDGQTSAGAEDLFIVKYNNNGVKQWTRQLGTASYDSATAITSDAVGNVYAAGVTNGALDGQTSAGGYDLFITKYNSDGVKQWTRQLGTASYDAASAITSDAAGNVYAAGTTDGALDGQTSAGKTDLFIVKYQSDGRKR